MYILTRKIKAMGIKVVLSGEGADEAFGGYLFFHKAPSASEYHSCVIDPDVPLPMTDVMSSFVSTGQCVRLQLCAPFTPCACLSLY
jgi:hypothetical protein